MILPWHLLAIVLIYLAAIYWLIPARYISSRLVFLGASSLAVLFFLSPVVALVAAGYGIVIASTAVLLKLELISVEMARKVSWLCFGGLALPEYLTSADVTLWVMGVAIDPHSQIAEIAWLGIGFAAIRSFVAMRELALSKGQNLLATLCNILFFASYSAGPVGRTAHFIGAGTQLNLGNAFHGVMRLGWGIALVSVIAPELRSASLPATGDFATAWLNTYRGFFSLYLNFAGSTHLAIAAALFFGVNLPENFKAPLLSTSVAAFWQRWHISFMEVIRTYFTAPIVRHTGNRRLALLIVFPLIGLWHQFTPQYVLWGLGHAFALLAYFEFIKTSFYQKLASRFGWALAATGWCFTISYVSALSAIANAQSWAAAKQLTHALLLGYL